MTARKTPGKTLVTALTRSLQPGTEWDETERSTLATIEIAADRLDALRKVCDKAIADPESSPTSIATLASEVRRLEVSIHGLIKSLDPGMVQAKSMRHVHAANARWHRGSAV